ncbi:flagellar biosynthetic protein FliO [Proteiniborus sp. MB09-C3]|uniref:flagellar biosynthetic protein FliO n=1 Tax=Proteiniborus sp. MB09-C3 TaxID=3050072 RepID=UPI002553C734|nr:flagellar biosynthetic protein FliO [Proteiniborus sp. MB09-C3]WIV13948.1 flagellar biosynthetic protein FliO [Proteiniborus sp. MB09-C3]
MAEIVKTTIYLGSFIIVIFLAFFFTKYIARKSSSLSRSKNIKIIEAISLGNNTRVFVIEIFEVIYIIYDNNSHLLLLDKFNKEDMNTQFMDSGTEKAEINSVVEKFLMRKDNIINKLGKKK